MCATSLKTGKDALGALKAHATQTIAERRHELTNLVEERPNHAGRSLGLIEVREGIRNRFLDHRILRHSNAAITLGNAVLIHPLGFGFLFQHLPLLRCKRAKFLQGMNTLMTKGADRILCVHRNGNDSLEVVTICGLTVFGLDCPQDV